MLNLPNVPIDWASVNWLYVTVLTLIVFLSTLIGTFISFKRTFLGSVLSALLFAAAFVFWTYYPLGLPASITSLNPPATAAVQPPPPAAAPTAPVKPANPVTTISPPPAKPQ